MDYGLMCVMGRGQRPLLQSKGGFMNTQKYPPHAKDLRKGRCSINHQVYLITTVTHQRQRVFDDFTLGRMVIQAMRQQVQQQKIKSLAFVLMPDHLHWLLSLENNSQLADVMRCTKGISAHKIQAIRRQSGDIVSHQALWQDGYYDRAIRKEEDLQQVARYVVANPLRAKLVNKVADYPLWDAVWL